MDHPSRSLEDSSDECSVVCEGLMKEISEGNNINNWTRNYSCDILVKCVPFLPLSLELS